MADLQLSVGNEIKPCATTGGPEMSAANPARRGGALIGPGSRRSLRSGLMRCRLILLPLVIMLMHWSSVTAAQAPGAGNAARLDPAAALETHKQVSEWLEGWETPTDALLPDGCMGVWVGIRLAGRPMGALATVDVSQLTGAGTNSDGLHVDLAPSRVLPAAVRRAMGAALTAAGGLEEADIRADRQKAFLESPFRTLELDLAHSPVRIRGTSLDRVMSGIRPGVDGLLIRRNGESFTVFPAEMLAFDTRPASALVSILAQAGVAPEMLDSEIANSTIRIWKFQTLHLAQANRTAPPTFLQRGSRPVPLHSIDETEIGRMADELAAYLSRSTIAHPDEPGHIILLGDYMPHTDRRLQERATFAEHALAALALLHYAQARTERAEQATAARRVAFGLLGTLAGDEPDQSTIRDDSRASALVCLAARRLRTEEWTDELTRLVDEAKQQVGRACPGNGAFAPDLAPEDRALVAAAIATREAMDAAWLSIGLESQTLAMPWIAWGELETAGASGAIPPLAALDALRARIWSRQVAGADGGAGLEDDLAGALRYRPAQAPDWYSAQLVAGAATMLGDSRCTPAPDRVTELLNLQRSIRYLRQLQAREVDRYRLRNPDMALGGVRAALWDQAMPTAASAMSLLAAAEMLRSLEQIRPGR